MASNPLVPDQKSGMEYLIGLGEDRHDNLIQSIDGHQYHVINEGATLVEYQPTLPKTLEIHTLSGLSDLTETHFEKLQDEANPGEGVFLHVVNYNHVEMVGIESDEFGRRKVLVKSTPVAVDGFQFASYHSHDSFIIGLLSKFQQQEGDDMDYLLKLASSITGEVVATSEDTGAGQMVNVRKGAIVQQEKSLIKQRVKLAPFRTFQEVPQPMTEFVFRLKQGEAGTVPTMGLFEADGGKWKLTAMEHVARHLRSLFKQIKVVC